MFDSHIKLIVEALESEEMSGTPEGGAQGPSTMDAARLLIGHNGVALTQHDGSTIQVNAEKIVVQLPNGKLMALEDVLSSVMGRGR